MNINDIVMISIYNYVTNDEIEFDDMYDNLCRDIAIYIEKNIINEELTIDYDKVSQLLLHFLTVEIDFDKFVKLEQQIMNYSINDDLLDEETRKYNVAKSHEIIKLYQNIDKEQIIIDIMHNVRFKQKIKSR